jgi:hypothetical protein
MPGARYPDVVSDETILAGSFVLPDEPPAGRAEGGGDRP